MYRNRLSRHMSRIKNSLIALLFIGTQVVAPLGVSGIFLGHAAAVPATGCVNDTAGANDVPGQKDLTKLCVNNNSATQISTTWNWDDTGTNGSNTLDACNLFDTNGNGQADYAVCVTTSGDPAQLQATTVYSCGDSRDDRCTSPITTLIVPAGTVSCAVSQSQTNPFDASFDTQGSCTIALSIFGATAANLIDVCSYPSQQPNSDPSDCVITQPKSGKVEVVKHLVPATDSGFFNLQVDGTTKAANVQDGGTTGEQVLAAGTHSVGETAGTNTSLAAYDSAISCRGLNGNGAVIANGTGTSLAGVPVVDGSDIVCTITNTRQTGTITLVKSVTENNGGTAGVNEFGLTIGGTAVSSGQAVPLNPGSYAINEAGKAGYAFVSITGIGCPSTLGASVTLAANQNITCTITNDDIAPSLTVVKNVTNDNGGTATADNFTLRVNNTQLSGGTLSNNNLTDTYTYTNPSANVAYAASEDSFSGYSPGTWSCTDNTTHQSVGNPVMLALGQNVTCSVTNNDNAPTLTLVKHVTNDNGGANTADQWTLKAQHNADTPVINAAGAPSNSGTVATTTTTPVTANTAYALTESGPTGYAPSSWGCTGGVLTNGVVTLGVGQNVTCTITNDDIAPKLTVTKVVNNDNGGTLDASNFPLSVMGTSGTVQVTSGTQYTFNAGQYTVSETQQSGYTLHSITGCLANGSITMVVGGVYSCTLTNNDIPATITVTKVVNNNHGGSAKVNDFTLKVGSTAVTSGVSNTFAANQQYTVSELAQVNGYHQDSLVCIDNATKADLGATFTPTLAENISCTITNSDIAPQLTVIKHVVNDNGGTASASAFTMNVTGTNVSSASFSGAEDPGTTVTLNAASYSVNETDFAGYAKSLGQNCSGNIAVGEQKTCVVTNNDVAPSLTVVKKVINNNGGNNTSDSFVVKVNGTQLTGGTLTNSNLTDTYSNPGTTANTAYTVSEDSPTPSYTQTSLVCKDNTSNSVVANPVSLASGQNVTCTITNDDVAPTLTVVKNVTNNDGGSAKADAFSINVNGTKLTGGTLSNSNQTDTYTYSNAQANTSYAVTEDTFTGYTRTSTICTDNDTQSTVTQPVSLNEGQHVTCVVANNDQTPHLNLHKNVTNNDGGQALATAWTLSATPSDAAFATISGNGDASGAARANLVYTLSESNGPSGYAASGWVCDAGSLVGNQLTLSLGVSASCSITNDDIAPKLTIIKHVINDNSGSADASSFTMNVSGTSVKTPVSLPGNEAGTTINVNAGSYVIDEGAHAGYTKTLSADCSGTISIAEEKTCTITNDDIAHPGIHVVKSGPATAHEGDTVTYTFTVTNTGDTALSGITVNDDIAGAGVYQSGDSNNDHVLQKNEIWIYTASYTIPLTQTADVVNKVTVCATDPANTQVCGNDNHQLDVLHPAITVKKSGPLYGYEGQLIGYSFVVTNTGDTTLTGVKIDDNIANLEKCDSSTLAPTEVTNCTASFLIPTPQTDNVVNVVVASGTDSLGKTVTDTDNHTLDVLHPAIHVVKSGPATAHEGDTVTYTFTVTNTGDTPLSGLTVSDNVATGAAYKSGDANDNAKLDLQETWIYTVQYTIPANHPANVVNTVTACGLDPIQVVSESPNATCGTSEHTLDVLHPAIHVVKTGPPNAYQGDTVTYTFTVTNTGDTPLSGLTVSDNVAPNVTYQSGDTNNDAILQNNETWVYTSLYTVPVTSATSIVNTVNTCGTDSLQAKVCSTDTHNLHIYHPQITVTKQIVNSSNNDEGLFNLLIDGAVAGSGASVGNGGTTGAVEVTPGIHSVGESAAGETNLADYQRSFSISCANGSVTVTGDEHADCTITNTRLGSITVIKSANPQSLQGFTFTGNLQGSDTPNFVLVDNSINDPNYVAGSNKKIFDHLAPSGGSYTFGEPGNVNHLGWSLDQILCSGDINGSINNRNVSLKLAAGQNIICTFYNSRDHANVTVHKVTLPTGAPDSFTLNLRQGETLTHSSSIKGGGSDTYQVDTDTYNMSEDNLPPNWDLVDATCTITNGERQTSLDPRNDTITLLKNDNLDCTYTNQKRATVIVTKYNDLNRNGTQDTAATSNLGVNEPSLSGWDITLGKLPTQTTGSDGTTTFSGVIPGPFTLAETLQAGWTQSAVTCDGEGVSEGVQVTPGSTVQCSIGNYQAAVINLAKTNNRPNPTIVGDTVTYSLVVTVPDNGGAVFDTTVTDLPPNNFIYVPGSWTAQSSVRGDLKAAGITTEPTYGSPGVWQLKNMLPGEKVTLTYRAKIGSAVSDGTYPDIAFVKGSSVPRSNLVNLAAVTNTTVYGNLSFTTTPFVATKVTILTPAATPVFTAGRVLGAAILINTGTSILAMQFALPLLLTALVVITRRATHYKEMGGK
ncbi:MAG: hypothetical protein QFB87_02865 [Patescibacteria group bacterium]|nr:hypothetical protein [Patescibacteria group bacterium]